MTSFSFGSLFAGIGGFDLGFERAGMQCKWQVENDPFCLKVLEKHWPEVPKYGDIKKIKGKNLEPVDLICGGFPCQSFSQAGKRRGTEDDRYLWPEMFRIIREVGPTWVVGENVPGIVNMALDTVLSDLESEGYTTRTFIIPACALNAPHRRDRVWIIAYRNKQGLEGRKERVQAWLWNRYQRFCQDVADTEQSGLQGTTRTGFKGISTETEQSQGGAFSGGTSAQGRKRPTQPRLGRMASRLSQWLDEPDIPRVATGIPDRVNRLKALGNAVVPQIPEVIGRIILENEALTSTK